MQNNKFLLLTLVFLLSLSAGCGIDLYAPSLPALANYFNTPAANAQLALTIYLFGYGIGQPIFGTLSDCYGRKKVLLGGVLVYTLASFAAILAGHIIFIIVMRLLQGIGGAAGGAVNKAILTDSFPAEALPKYTTFMTICWGLGPIIAPVIGSYLQHYFGWQSNFIFQGLQSAITLLFILLVFKETNLKLMQFKLPVIAKTYAAIISHKVFIGSVLCMALMYSMIVIFNVMAPFLIQEALHYSVVQYGRIALVIGMAYFLGTSLNRVLIIYHSTDKLLTINTYISLIICIAMLVGAFILGTNLWLVTVPSFLLFFVGGMIFPNCMAKAMVLFRESGGAASAVMGTLFVVGTFLMGYIASLLNASSILSLSYAYLVLTLSYFIVSFFFFRHE